MSIDLLKSVQKNLGYPELKMIDPNTAQAVENNSKPSEDSLTQAVVSAVLAGIYKLAKNEDGIEKIASETSVSNWVEIIFGVNKPDVLKNISAYSNYSPDAVEDKMNEVATEAIKLSREATKTGENMVTLRNFLASQRNNILPYLPPALHIGSMLEDTTIDDTTAKMEGPISTLMHKLETVLSGHETKEEADRKHF